MADFNEKDMMEYIEGRVKDNAISCGEDFVKECMKYYIKSKSSITCEFSSSQVMTLITDANGNLEGFALSICNEYHIEIKDYSELSDKFGKAWDVMSTVYDLCGDCKELYKAWSRYIKEDTPEGKSEVMQSIFNLLSTVADIPGGPIGKIISEQLELGSFLLKKGTELAVEYNKRYEQLEEIWEEMEAEESELSKEEMQEKINNAITDSNGMCMKYAYSEMYDALYKEYKWIFDMADSDTRKKLAAQQKEILEGMSAGDRFMDSYNKLLQYATVTDYLGVKDNRLSLGSKFNEAEDEKDPPVDPIVIDINNDGIFSVSVEEGAHFDYDGDGFAEKSAWLSGGDGFLVRDINGNGIIDDGRELFGDRTILSDGSIAADGFEAMADIVLFCKLNYAPFCKLYGADFGTVA